MIIYKITNKVNSKIYVGQTVQPLKKRWAHHKWRSQAKLHPLYESIRKYGFDAFSIEALEELPRETTFEEFNAREVHWIKMLNTMVPNGYNLTSGGDGKFYLSDETKQKISKTKMGHTVSIEARAKISNALIGTVGPNNGREFSAEWRANIGNTQLGRKASEETKAKMSATHKARLAVCSKRSPAQLESLKRMHEKNRGGIPWNKGKKLVGK